MCICLKISYLGGSYYRLIVVLVQWDLAQWSGMSDEWCWSMCSVCTQRHWIMEYIHVFHPTDQPLAVQICSKQI